MEQAPYRALASRLLRQRHGAQPRSFEAARRRRDGRIGGHRARDVARLGARVAILARGAERLADAEQEVRRLGGEALGLSTDVADCAQVERAADEVERRWGPIDVWDARALTRSLQWWLSTHRVLAASAAIVVLMAASVWVAA